MSTLYDVSVVLHSHNENSIHIVACEQILGEQFASRERKLEGYTSEIPISHTFKGNQNWFEKSGIRDLKRRGGHFSN